ncbi:MAG: hypothetical protein ACRDGS_13590, partial [Chloroflexota bacterium]
MTGSTDLSLESLRGKQLRMARRRATAITLLGGALADPVGEAMLALLDCLDHRPMSDTGAPAPRGSLVARTYARVFALLAAEGAPALEAADAWQSHLLWRVVDDQNPFSRAAAAGGAAAVAPSVLDQARRDLRGLQWLYSLDADAIREAASALVGEELSDALASWRAVSAPDSGHWPRTAIARRLSLALDWGAMAEDLAAHWRAHGLGLFARVQAARWSARAGGLEGITHPDQIRLEELIAY